MASSWLPKRRTGLPVMCLPPSGGTGTSFASWIEYARPQLDIAGMQLPGRGIRLREPAIEAMPTLIEAMGQALGPALSEDYVILGYCFGGLIAFELARWLERSGFRKPNQLVVCGCAAPSNAAAGELAALSDDELVAQLRRWGGTSEEALANKEIMAMTLRPLRDDLRLLAGYHPRAEPIDLPILALYGSDDATLTANDIEGWRSCTTGAFRARAVSGGHFPAANVLVPVLREELGVG